MKRTLVVVAALLVGFTLPLFANGSREKSTSANQSKQGSVVRTLTVWHYFSEDSQVKELTDLAALFNKSNKSVKVNYVFVPVDSLAGKVIAAGAANSGPDVIIHAQPTVAPMAQAGALKDLSTYWQSFAGKDQFSEAVLGKVDGKLYGVQGYVNLLGLWYNKTILDKLGIKPPATISQLTSDLKAAKEAGYTGITLTGKPNAQGEWQAYPWLSAYGWDYGNPQVSSIEKAFSTVASWVQNGYLPQIVVNWGQAEPFQDFLTGKVAFCENGNWQIGAAKSKAKFAYGIVPMPSGSQNAKVYLGGEQESIGAFSKIPNIAWEYLTKTYFSEAGQIIALQDVGSIPARKDAASAHAVADNELLAPFGFEVRTMGALRTPAVGPMTKVTSAQLAVARQWSAMIAGQESPEVAAQKAVADVESELGG